MLTKTKKWLIVFVLSFVALFLVACGNDEDEPVAPEALQVIPEVYVGDRAVVVGKDMLLGISVTPSNASKEVDWALDDESIAEIDQNGNVTGLKPGVTTVTAKSKLDETVTDQFRVRVLEDLDKSNVLFAALDYVRENMPTYISEDTQLPQYPNPDVEIEYFNNKGVVIKDGLYKLNYTKDLQTNVNYNIHYNGETLLDLQSTLYEVKDVKKNDFTIINDAIAEVNDYLEFYKTYKVYSDIALPKSLSELREYTNGEVPENDVKIKWATDKTEISNTGVFTRPNEDVQVQLESYFTYGNNSAVSRNYVTAKGYTQEEKVEWLKENVLNIPKEIDGSNILLPFTDSKFNTSITWKSSDETVYTSTGKMADPFQAKPKKVTMTAIVTYSHTDENNSFTQEIDYEVTINPCETDIQRLALELNNNLEQNEDLKHLPYGGPAGNILPVPLQIEEGEFKGVPIQWEAEEEGLFDPNLVLQKQYLRYHQAVLTYTLTVGPDTATGEIVVNVGVATTPDTLYIGGRFASRSDANQPYDELHTFSKFDEPVGNAKGGSMGFKGWTGLTFYRDVDGVRYQYFANDPYTYYVREDDEDLTIEEDGFLSGTLTSNTGLKHSNYQYMVVVNETTKDIKIPISFLNYKSSIIKDVNGSTLIRQMSIAYDGWRIGFATDGDGKVVMGYGSTSIEEAMTAADAIVEYVVIPAGGIGWTPFTSQNAPALGDIFCVEGTELVIEKYDVLS